jgi:hypothetical protein
LELTLERCGGAAAALSDHEHAKMRASDKRDPISKFAFPLGEIRTVLVNQCCRGHLVMGDRM